MHHTCHCWIHLDADIGPGFPTAHVGAISIVGGAWIGSNCDNRRNLSGGGIYNKVGEDGRSKPWIGDNVSFGIGAVVSGSVKIGSNSIIGANSLVTRDVPESVMVVGVPAQVIKERWSEDSGRKVV